MVEIINVFNPLSTSPKTEEHFQYRQPDQNLNLKLQVSTLFHMKPLPFEELSKHAILEIIPSNALNNILII